MTHALKTTYIQFILLISFFLIGGQSLAQFNVDFSASPTTICAGQAVQFTDQSTSPTAIVSWVWDFGDGNSSTLQNPSHVYASAGTYTVILTANNGSGSQDEVKTGYILVNPLPQPAFSVSTPPCNLPASVTVSNVQPNAGGYTYQWNFGNGQNATGLNPPAANYNAEGTFPIVLTVTNTATGCSNQVTHNVSIYNYTAEFTSSVTTACVGSPVTFTNASSPGTNANAWTFGNGQSSNGASPSVVYNTAGTYTVTLTSQNTTIGCSDVVTHTITVVNAQIPVVSPSVTMGCNPLSVTFTNSNPFNGTYNWNFGNGQTYSGQNPPAQTYSMPEFNEYPYSQSQGFNVTLLTIDANGCVANQNLPNLITIYNIFPAMTVDIDEGCEDLISTFTNQSFSPIPGFPINSWQWNFGNGQTYSGQTPPPQTYSEGEYNVSLTVSTAMGCTTTLDSITMIEVGIPPNVLFTVDPDTICARTSADFTNLSTISIPADPADISYAWTIGSQGPYPNFEPDIVQITDTGSLDVTLIVSFRGCNDTLTLEDEIFVNAPLVQFGNQGVFCNPSLPVEVSFYETSILGQPGDSVEVFWDLGDGTNLYYNNSTAWLNNNQSLLHSYTDYGNYIIEQKIHSFTTGCTDSLSSQLIINYFTADLTFLEDSVCLGNAVEYSWSDVSIEQFPVFNYGYVADGDSILGTLTDPVTNPDSCIINSIGEHTITVNLVNAVGCPASDTDTFFVMPLPIATIGSIQQVDCSPLTVTFSDASTSVSGIPIVGYNWILNGVTPGIGNGLPSITTVIPTNGNYTTTLTVMDDLGCMNSTTITTPFLQPEAIFTLPAVLCNNDTLSSLNVSTNYTQSQWYWNGQLQSTNQDANFVIQHPDNNAVTSYNDSITLIVFDAIGCSDTLTVPFIVSAPNADFTYNLTGSNVDQFGNFTCPSVFSAFTDQSASVGAIVNWNWSFGDGKFSTLQNPSNTYVYSGTYTSSLTITDEYGCHDSIAYTNFLTIDGPSGEFSVEPAYTFCDPNYLYEVVSTDNVANIVWFTGDGNSFQDNLGGEYIYGAAGTYYPYVEITDANNCLVTYYLDTITVQYGDLNAAFDASPLVLNWGEPLVIDNQSTGGIGGIVTYNWTFGSENFNNSANQFGYLFNETGELDVLLITTDSLGCIDSAWISVFVTDNLQFPNVFSPNGDEANDVFRIKDNAYGEYDVYIYNRWGNKMSEAHIIDDDYLWDGKNQSGELASEGVYFYVVKGTLRDGQPKEDQGFFHLVLDH